MKMQYTYLTREGHEKLMKQLEFLRGAKRREFSKAIQEARAHGDISENAEYDAAKDAQALNEKRIVDMETTLSRARIIDDQDIPTDEVAIGATVDLKDLNTGREFRYTLLSEEEADFDKGKIAMRTVGDVDFEAAVEKVGAITPVPGGVGPVTVAMLLKNTIACTKAM